MTTSIKYTKGRKLTPFPPVNRLCFHVVLPWIPSCESEARLRCLILQIVGQDLASFLTGNIIGLVISIEKIAVVRIAMLVISRDIIVIGIMVLQMILLGLLA